MTRTRRIGSPLAIASAVLLAATVFAGTAQAATPRATHAVLTPMLTTDTNTGGDDSSTGSGATSQPQFYCMGGQAHHCGADSASAGNGS